MNEIEHLIFKKPFVFFLYWCVGGVLYVLWRLSLSRILQTFFSTYWLSFDLISGIFCLLSSGLWAEHASTAPLQRDIYGIFLCRKFKFLWSQIDQSFLIFLCHGLERPSLFYDYKNFLCVFLYNFTVSFLLCWHHAELGLYLN